MSQINTPSDDMTDSDIGLLMTKDPAQFIDKMSVTLLYAAPVDLNAEGGPAQVDNLMAHYRRIFLKWLSFTTDTYRDTIAKSVQTKLELRNKATIDEQLAQAELRGRIAALAELPIKRGALGTKSVDITMVTAELRALKGRLEPNHASTNNSQTPPAH